jgi:hypothetical protein
MAWHKPWFDRVFKFAVVAELTQMNGCNVRLETSRHLRNKK